jgi:hypothetical protein
MSIPYSSVVVALALIVGQTPAGKLQTKPASKSQLPRPPVVGPRVVGPVLESTEGLRLAWDYPDEDLKGEWAASAETAPIKYAITEFRVQWSEAVPPAAVGMPVLSEYPGGKTYATPLPPGPWAVGIHTIALRACPTPSAVPCSEPSTVSFTVDPPPPYTLTVAPNTTTSAATVTITFNCVRDCGLRDWIGMFPLGQNEAGADLWWPNVYTDGKASGSYTAPASACTPGKCSVHYCTNDSYVCPVGAPLTVTAAGPIDCVVSEWSAWSAWSAWKPIDQTLEGRTRSRTRTITTEPANHGVACPPLEEVESETRPLAPPLMAPAATAIRCNWQLTANPPDAAGGWRAQFRRDGTDVGNPDGSPPYSRNVQVDAGGPYAFSVVWTKTGQSAQTSVSASKVCE